MPRDKEKQTKTITPEKFNWMKKVYLNLKIGFQIIALFILLEVGYLVAIAVNFVYKWARQKKKWMNTNVVLTGALVSLFSRSFTIFQGGKYM